MAIGRIQSPGDTDWFKVSLKAGTTYAFDLTGLDSATFVDVVPADAVFGVATPLLPHFGSSQTVTANFTADTTGTYYVRISNLDSATARYDLTAAKVRNSFTLAHPGSLAAGGSVKASIESPGDTDWFKVTLKAGTTYAFVLKGLDYETQLTVVSAADATDTTTQLFPFTGMSQTIAANLTADASGTYYVRVNNVDGEVGNYTLSAAVVTNTYTLAHPGTLKVGGSVKATIQSAGDTDWFKISLKAGVTYQFDLNGLNSASTVTVFSARLAADQQTPIATPYGSPETLGANFTADTSGNYFVRVNNTNGEVGRYTLSDAIVTNSYTLAHPGTLKAGGLVHASIQSAGDTDWFKISLQKGSTYEFDLTGLDGDTFLDVVLAKAAADTSTTLNAFASNTSADGGNITADETGIYYVRVNNTDGETGKYVLSASKVTNSYTQQNPGTLAVGHTVAASLQSAGDSDWFTIALKAGTTYQFDLIGLDQSSSLAVLSSRTADTVTMLHPNTGDGPVTTSVNYTADKTGTYFVLVNNQDSETGRYSIHTAVVANTYTPNHPGTLTVG